MSIVINLLDEEIESVVFKGLLGLIDAVATHPVCRPLDLERNPLERGESKAAEPRKRQKGVNEYPLVKRAQGGHLHQAGEGDACNGKPSMKRTNQRSAFRDRTNQSARRRSLQGKGPIRVQGGACKGKDQ